MGEEVLAAILESMGPAWHLVEMLSQLLSITEEVTLEILRWMTEPRMGTGGLVTKLQLWTGCEQIFKALAEIQTG